MIFFGNYFYGLCAVALSIEASLQQRFPLNRPVFFILLFSITVLYYTKAYIQTETPANSDNLRALWYAQNKTLVRNSQILLTVIAAVCLIYFLARSYHFIFSLYAYEYFLILVFPLTSASYYGIGLPNFNLRNVGWLKPFIIGFTWAGMVNIYPILYYNILHGIHYTFTTVGILLFVKNFMFVTVLCIMFDIKDYAMDYNQHLKTFMVKAGLRKTIFYIIIPLTVMGLISFLFFAFLQHFHSLKIALNTIPFLLILIVARSLQTRKSIFYYLAIIDGLMLVKALCGTFAMLYF